MSNTEIIKVKCPTCQKIVEWSVDSRYRPFCSKRCQLSDLGDWANEENRLPSNEVITDDEIWSEQQLYPADRKDK